MHFIIQYSIFSFVVFVIVIFYNLRIRKLKNFQNNVFLLYCFLGAGANALDLIRCAVMMSGIPVVKPVFFLCNLVYYLTVDLLPVCFMMYCISIVKFFHIKNHIPGKFNFILIPYIVSVLYILISCFFQNPVFSVIYIEKGTSLIKNGYIGYLFLDFSSLFYIVGGYGLICYCRKSLEPGVLFHLTLSVLLMVGTLTAQFLFPYARILSFALSMSTLDFSLYIQRSDDVYDNQVGVINETGFKRYLDYLFIRHIKFNIYSIIMDDVAFYKKALGEKDRNNLESCIINALKSNFRKRNYSVYKLKYGSYALIVTNPRESTSDEILTYIKNQIGLRWGFTALELALSFRICEIESGKDVKSNLEVRDLIDFVISSKKLSGQIIKASEFDLFRIHSISYLESCIRKGLLENRFEVYYQPIYSVKEQKLTGAEALIRLRDDDGNFVSPEDFIPIAEQNGTIFEIGKFVFNTVCKSLSEINRSEYNISKVDINLSVIQCIQEDMHKQLISIRNQYNLPSSLINLEITETASTSSPDVLLVNMKYLEADGIELALDDYGSGNSNISYILNLPFKMIKIDKKIVWKAFEDEKGQIALRSIIDMIKSLGLIALSEGVETEEQAKLLQEIGCDYLQGYYYSRPLPLKQFLEVMKK